VIPDTLPLVLTRTYRPRDTVSRPFGIGATHPYELFIVGDTFPYTFADLILPDGGRVHYDRISPGTGFSDAVYEHTETPSIYYKTQIRYVGGRWHLTLHDGTVYEFPDAENAPTPRQAAMVAMHDRFGNAYVFTRDSNSNLTKITSPNGRYIEFTYDTSFRITQAKDNIGRTVNYTYDSSGRLWKVTDANGGVTEHLYDTSNRMTKITDPRGILYLTNQYDTNGRVIKQTQADSTFFTFAYTLNGSGQVTQTNVTDPRGNVRRVTFNTGGAILTDTYALGKPEQQTITYLRQAGTNHILSETDALGRRTDFTYDDQGNTLSITRLAGTSGAVTTSYTYDTTFSQLTSITDPLNHTVTFGLDALGNITSVTDHLHD
jgi:YD repeat-containing protein